MSFLPGDIAACHGVDFSSRVIRFTTASIESPCIGPSHVAILAPFVREVARLRVHPEGAVAATALATSLQWFESTSMCPSRCLVQGRPVWGVQVQDPQVRIKHYVAAGGRVDLYRLAKIHEFSNSEAADLSCHLLSFVGEHYDLAGAMLSGTRVFQASKLFPGADLHSVFCSELIAAVLMRMGRMNHSNPTRFNPARLLRELVRSGVYSRVETIRCER